MNCKHCQKLFHQYLDEALPSSIRTSVEEHLQTCRDCRQALVQQRNFSTSISQLLARHTDSLTVRPDIQRNVLRALESAAPSPKTRIYPKRVFVRPAIALTAATFLTVAAILALHNHKPQPVRPAQPVVRHPKSYIMCMATTYADETKTDWIERRMIVVTRNGGEGYLNIIARKPSKPDEAKQNEKEEKS
ncbi:zf-HC2 domain-containing protein [bacterium]|nr:zf-HC2 domain-containing protein [bacterium]